MIFFTYIKISKDLSAKYYKDNRLKKVFVKYIKTFLKKQIKKYAWKQYKNLSVDGKQNLVEYRKK